MPTIKEIAQLAGVSRGTVDRVLNHRGSVSTETAQKIQELAKALHYTPNKAGMALAAQKKKLKIGVVLFVKGHPFFEEVMVGIERKAKELAGYNCTVLTRRVPFDVEAQLAAIDALVDEGVHGIVLTPCNAPEIAARINLLADRGIPVVTANTDIQGSRRLAYVGSDYYRSGQLAGGLMGLLAGGGAADGSSAEHSKASNGSADGALHVGIVTGFSRILCHTERIAGFRDCIAKQYPALTVEAVVENQDDDFISYEVTGRLLADHPEVNALYFTAAGIFGGCRALLAARPGGSVKVITYDSAETTKELLKQGVICATICQQPLVQGSKPIDILFHYLTSGQKPGQEFYYLPADIRIRENI